MIVKTDKLAERVKAARVAWEEMDPAYTTFEMRKRAEARYLSLLALSRANVGPVVVRGPSAPRTAAGWRRLAVAGVAR